MNLKQRKDNTMKKLSVFFILSFLLLLIAAQPSYAEPKSPVNKMEEGFHAESISPMMPTPCGMGPVKGMPVLQHLPGLALQSINLDDKQKEAIKEIENSVTKELIRKKANEKIAEIELGELLDKDTVDLKAVEVKLKQIGIIKTESQLIIIKSIEKMKEKLTPKQRTLLKKQAAECRMKPPLKGKTMPDNPPFAG
jgi:Spy/CpxP family protein refolding chaperone